MTTERPRRFFGRTSLALAVAAVLSPVIGFLVIRRDWAGHDFSIELAAEGFVVTMFAVVGAGFFALCAVIAGGIGLARKEPDRWAGVVGLTLGGLGVAVVLAIAAVVYSAPGKAPSGTKPADAPASQSPEVPSGGAAR